jgi:hypothetical protein
MGETSSHGERFPHARAESGVPFDGISPYTPRPRLVDVRPLQASQLEGLGWSQRTDARQTKMDGGCVSRKIVHAETAEVNRHRALVSPDGNNVSAPRHDLRSVAPAPFDVRSSIELGHAGFLPVRIKFW